MGEEEKGGGEEEEVGRGIDGVLGCMFGWKESSMTDDGGAFYLLTCSRETRNRDGRTLCCYMGWIY